MEAFVSEKLPELVHVFTHQISFKMDYMIQKKYEAKTKLCEMN